MESNYCNESSEELIGIILEKDKNERELKQICLCFFASATLALIVIASIIIRNWH